MLTSLRRPLVAIYSRTMTTVAQQVYNVIHNKKEKKFVINLEKGDAVLEYEIETGNVINMYHTGVPPEYRGQGIAKHVVQKALSYAVDNSLIIKPQCSYVAKYIKDHPNSEYKVVE